MMRGLYSAATGMKSQQTNVDTISNNIANVNTNGFKRSRADFQDLFYETLQQAGSSTGEGTLVVNGIQIGQGSKLAATKKDFGMGMLKATNEPLDLAIIGDGFFQVTLPSGEIGYTRAGSFSVDADGKIVTSQGYPLEPEVTIPEDARDISISNIGAVQANSADSNDMEDVGDILLAKFINSAGLQAMGENIFLPTDASGDPTEDAPGASGLGELRQNHLESSNVKIIDEMVDLITAQRAYEVNAKTIQASEDMLAVANGIKR